MKTLKLTTAILAASLVAVPVVAQEAVAPADPVAPGATVGMFVPPEGYTLKADWIGVTAEQITGADILGPEGTSIGSVSDVAIAGDGSIGGLIADIGGFLGIGSHTVNLPTSELALYSNADGDLIVHSPLGADALKSLPEYTAG